MFNLYVQICHWTQKKSAESQPTQQLSRFTRHRHTSRAKTRSFSTHAALKDGSQFAGVCFMNFTTADTSKALALDGAANLAASGCSPLTAFGNSLARRWRAGDERARDYRGRKSERPRASTSRHNRALVGRCHFEAERSRDLNSTAG